jgi:hypothetical protein
MPLSAKKPCAYPGCHDTIREGRYCSAHKTRASREYDKTRRSPDHNKIYGHRWRKIRELYVSKHPLCERCLESGKYIPVKPSEAQVTPNGISGDAYLIERNGEDFIITVSVSREADGDIQNNGIESITFTCDGYDTQTVYLPENKYNLDLGNIVLEETDAGPLKGNGTEEAPFIITDAEDIMLIVSAIETNSAIKGTEAKSAHYLLGII